MDKCNNIIDYYEGNLAYTYFLLSFIFDKQICFDNVIEKKNITAAETGVRPGPLPRFVLTLWGLNDIMT